LPKAVKKTKNGSIHHQRPANPKGLQPIRMLKVSDPQVLDVRHQKDDPRGRIESLSEAGVKDQRRITILQVTQKRKKTQTIRKMLIQIG
jgi:hypothetical protein